MFSSKHIPTYEKKQLTIAVNRVTGQHIDCLLCRLDTCLLVVLISSMMAKDIEIHCVVVQAIHPISIANQRLVMVGKTFLIRIQYPISDLLVVEIEH